MSALAQAARGTGHGATLWHGRPVRPGAERAAVVARAEHVWFGLKELEIVLFGGAPAAERGGPLRSPLLR